MDSAGVQKALRPQKFLPHNVLSGFGGRGPSGIVARPLQFTCQRSEDRPQRGCAGTYRGRFPKAPRVVPLRVAILLAPSFYTRRESASSSLGARN